MKRYVPVFLSILVLFAVAAGALWLSIMRRAELADKAHPEPPAYAVFIDTAEAGAITFTRQFLGTVEPVENALVSFRTTGHVKSAEKDTGEYVTEGEIIAAIDKRPIKRQKQAVEAELAGAKSDLVQAERQLERRKLLLEKGHIDPEAIEAAESAYETARSRVDSHAARLAAAEIDLAYTTAYAPFDGVITARHKQKGDLAMPGEPVYAIENPDAGYKVIVQIPRETALSAAPGDTALVTFNLRSIETILHRVYPSTQKGRLALAEIRLEQRPFGLPSGSFVGVDLHLGEVPGIRVSARTLLEDETGAKVFRVSNQNLIEVIEVTVIGKKGGDAVIAGPVFPGERLVVAEESMLLRLADGSPVTPLNKAADIHKAGDSLK